MDTEEARRTLGLDGTTTAEARRRAYLRAVRAHAPDRDPIGFQRVREAYEILDGEAKLAAVLAAAGGASVRVPSQAPSVRAASALPLARPPVVVLIAPRIAPASTMSGVPPAPAAAKLSPRAELERRAGEFVEDCRGDAFATGALVARVHELGVALFDFGMGACGREVLRAIEERIAREGVRASELTSDAGARFVILHELAALAERMGDDVAAAFANGLKTHDYRVASRTLEAEVQLRGSNAKRAVKMLAPTLFRGAFGDDTVRLPRGMRAPGLRGGILIVIVWVLWTAFKVFVVHTVHQAIP
jgi:hypothetical protein